MNQYKYACFFAICLLVGLVSSLEASSKIDEISGLPPGEQFRQLNLILMISAGADPAMLASMEPEPPGVIANVNPDDYKTPLIRIVDQESMLTGAAFLLRFARESRSEITARLASINEENPILISMADLSAVTEDAIIIRNAIADAIGYSNLIDDPVIAARLADYRTRTIRIRNVMEYEFFNEQLEYLTDEAIASVGGKLDAYQRMFDEEVESEKFDRDFDAAEYLYNRTDKFNEKAGKLTEEIMKNVIMSESEVDP